MALGATWLLLLAFLWVRRPDEMTARAALKLLPDVLTMLRRLAADPEAPRRVRVRLGLLLAYLALPIDLVPDFIPVVSYADDVVIVVFTLRSVIRDAGLAKVEVHWPGSPDTLGIILHLAGVGGITQAE